MFPLFLFSIVGGVSFRGVFDTLYTVSSTECEALQPNGRSRHKFASVLDESSASDGMRFELHIYILF